MMATQQAESRNLFDCLEGSWRSDLDDHDIDNNYDPNDQIMPKVTLKKRKLGLHLRRKTQSTFQKLFWNLHNHGNFKNSFS